MTVPDEWDCSGTDEMVCPYCGEEQSDSWEVPADDGDMSCGHCSRTFRYTRNVSVSYTTTPIVGPHQLSEFFQELDAQDKEQP